MNVKGLMPFWRTAAFSLILLGALTGFTAVGKNDSPNDLTPVRPRCEYAADPLGVDVAHPRLFWQVASTTRGQRQTAYQILVASSPEILARDRGDLWDTGKVTSDETIHVPYQGSPLTSSQQVFWKVRAWDKDDKPSAWSRPTTWTMGLLDETDWGGQWIVAPWTSEALLLRREFNVKPGLKRALAHVCGLGQYEMTVNGRKAGEDLLSPGWTNYDKTCLYDTRDVSALLVEGPNAVGLALGNGMYHTERRNRFSKFQGSFGPLRAIAQIELYYQDGTTGIIGTDQTWRVHPGPITFNDIFGGEDYDARKRQPGWDRPGFDDADWTDAVLPMRPKGALRGLSYAAPPLGAIETIRPVSIDTITTNVEVIDLGQNASYMPRIRVSGPAGSTVRLTHAELLHPDGTIDRNSCGGNRGPAWWQYTKATGGTETWFPQFFYAGCRYLQVELMPSRSGGRPPTLESVEGVVVHSTAAPTGDFDCSNPLLGRIRTLVRWAQRSNMVSILTDCPHREKLGWLEQYHLNGPSIRYEFDVARIFVKGMNDMADAQHGDGMIPNIAPEYTAFKGNFLHAAEWGCADIIVPWQQYQWTGDVDLLRRHYDSMKRYVAYLDGQATDRILSQGLGDWYDQGPKKPGQAQFTPAEVTATAFYYYDAHLLSQIASLLGEKDDARRLARLAADIRRAYNKKFFHKKFLHPRTAHYAAGSQCANAIPLVMGLVEPANRAAVLDAVVKDVRERGNAITAGDIGFRYLLRALADGGRSDVIYEMINQTDKPGYGYQLKMGATSLTEAWNANRGASQNHFMLGQIIEWFYGDLAGIAPDPAGPGFKKIVIRPQPVGDLTWAQARYDSIRGPIAVRWDRKDGRFTLKITIPANATATVCVPDKPDGVVTESGVRADRSEGVTFLRREGDRMVYAVASGTYAFQSQW